MATSLKLPPELKARIEAVVKGSGKSPHAFMLEAIEQQTRREEQRKQFVEEALEAEKEVLETGLIYDADEVHAAFEERVRGGKFVRPKPRPWRK